jgi:hypothetical protein
MSSFSRPCVLDLNYFCTFHIQYGEKRTLKNAFFFSCIGSKHVPGAATLKLVNMSINLFEVYILLFSIKGEVKRKAI